jgi:hypothetical protein
MFGGHSISGEVRTMTIDTEAIFDVGRCEGLDWLLFKLEGMPSFIYDLGEYRPYWQPQKWAVRQDSPMTGPHLVGPCGFSIQTAEGILTLYHMMRFSTFTSDVGARQSLRRSCMMLADMVGSPKMICTHELMRREGTSIAMIASWMEREIGPPAVTFEELRQAEYFGPRAWYIDSFADLR